MHNTPAILLDVGEHDFLADHDLNFPEYRYFIGMYPGALYERTTEGLLKWREAQVNPIFEKVKSAGKYRLMMVDDLQVLLAQYDPS